MVNVRQNYDPGSCSKSNHGDLILVKDRENRDTLLICTENNGVYNWKTTDSKASAYCTLWFLFHAKRELITIWVRYILNLFIKII